MGKIEGSVNRKSKQIGRGSSRGRHDGFSPVIAAVVALEGLAFIALGAATQTELHVTVLDVVISVAAIATVVGTAGLAKPREVSAKAVTREMDTLELEQVRHRIAVHAPQYAQMDGPLAERPLAERLKSAKLQRPSFPTKILRDAGIRAGEPSAAWAAEFRHATGTAGGIEGIAASGEAIAAARMEHAQGSPHTRDDEIRREREDAIAFVSGAPASEAPVPLAHAEAVAPDPFDWTAALRAEAEALAAQRPEAPPLEKEAARRSAEVEPQIAAIEATEEESIAEDESAPELSALVRALDSLRDASAPVPDAPPVAAETNGPRAVRETGAGDAVPTARARVRRTSRPSAARRRGRRLVRDGARRAVGAAASGPDDEDPLRRTLTLITPSAAPATDRPELLLRLNLDGDTLAALLRLVEQGANVQSVQPKLVTLPGGKLDAQPS